MRGSATGKLPQCLEITPREGFFLDPAPLLQLPFVFDGIGNVVEPLREYQRYRPSSCSIAAKRSSVMLCNSQLKRRARRSDVEASIGASKNVEKGAFDHPRLTVLRSPNLTLRSAKRVSKGEATPGPHGSRRRYALPHHEEEAPPLAPIRSPDTTADPHPEERRSRVSKGEATPGPHGSRRRYAPPHHEENSYPFGRLS
jgi:hypothetical protein